MFLFSFCLESNSVCVDGKKISAVSAGSKYIAVGSDDGYLLILSAKLQVKNNFFYVNFR